MASSYNRIRCVWIMVISHSKTLLCWHGVLGSNTPLHERRVWQYKYRIACANILNGYNKPFALPFHSSSGWCRACKDIDFIVRFVACMLII